MVKKMDMDFFNGQMDQSLKDTLDRTKLKEKELIFGLIRSNILGIGKIIKWKDKVYLLGQMVEGIYNSNLVMLESIKMIKNMVLENFAGLMVENIGYKIIIQGYWKDGK